MEYLVDKFLDALFWIIEGVIGLLPTYTPENGGMIQSIVNWLATFNQYLPMVELVECMAFYLAFVAIYMAVKPLLKLGRLS